MKTKTLALAILMIALIFSACGRTTVQPGGTPAATFQPTSTKQIPFLLPTLYPPTLERTSIPFPTDWLPWKSDPTEVAKATSIASFPNNCGYEYSSLISPNGNWLAVNCFQNGIILLVTSRDGSKQWKIIQQASSSYDMNDPNWGGNFCGSSPYHWSNDNRYLYFYLYYCIEQSLVDETWYQESLPRTLYVMDTLNGHWQVFVGSANWFYFSPTGRRLICFLLNPGKYHEDDQKTIVTEKPMIYVSIIDLKNGATSPYSLADYVGVSDVIWSTDGKKAIFAVERGLPIYFPDVGNHSYIIFMIDMDSRSLTELTTFSDSEKVILPLQWIEGKNILVLRASQYISDVRYDEIYFDLNSQKIITSTPTP
jgi:hypothetical protein